MKTLPGFVLRFVILFGLLAWPWPPLRGAISAGYRAEIRWLAGAFLPPDTFRVVAFSDPRYPGVDTVAKLSRRNETSNPVGQTPLELPFDSVSQGWIPFAMLAALIGATPLPWGLRWRALALGILLMLLLGSGTILISLFYNLDSDSAAIWPRVPLTLANRLLVENIWFSMVPPFLFWAVWLAWGGHWAQLGKIKNSATTAPR